MISKVVLGIAKKEFLDNWRNKWIIALSAIFLILTLLVSYFGSIGNIGWKDFGFTISGMMNLVQLLIPIIALMLGYAAIVGEKEKGSIGLLLSLPVTRYEVILGKFLGLGAVLSSTILIGFGVAGIVIGVNVANVAYAEYLIFIMSSILFGLTYLAIALLLSSVFSKRSTAMGGAIFLWFFFNIIWLFVMSGVLFFTYEKSMNFFYALDIVNPTTAYNKLIELTIQPLFWDYPLFYTTGLMVMILLLWITASLLIASWIFKRKDI